MKTRNYLQTIKGSVALATLALTLAACGKDIPVAPVGPTGPVGPVVPAFCQPPAGIFERTVWGNIGSGSASIRLDIFTNAQGRIAAVGEVSIPSLESLYSIDNTFGVFDPTLSGVQGAGYTGAHTAFVTCVGTNGFTGDLNRDRAYQDINLTLLGEFGTYIEMGSVIGGVQTYLVNENIEGSIKLRVGNYPQGQFLLSR